MNLSRRTRRRQRRDHYGFEERDGKTYLMSRSLFPSKEALDTVLATGMDGGMRETMDQLDELVTTLR